MKYIICGPFTNEESEKYMDVLPAAGKYLNNFADGLEKNGCEVIRAVYIPYEIFPEKEELVRRAYTKEQILVLKDGDILKSVKEYQKRILEYVDKDTVVVFYNITYFLFGLFEKVVRKGGKPLLIVADHGHSSSCTNFKRKMYAYACEYEFKKFEKVIILSAETKIKFRKNAQISVMEGGIKFSAFENFAPPKRLDAMHYTSTGNLKPLLGIDNILSTVSKSKRNDFVFTFSGRGDSVPVIEEVSKSDKRVICKGFLSREEYSKMMDETNVFVSARNMEFEKNNNSFPSKILEYLATGRIIISTRFPGYKKFENNIIFYDGSDEALLKLMDELAENYEELAEKYYVSNREFVKTFDWEYQARKIIEFMK